MLAVLSLVVLGLAATVVTESNKRDWNQCYYAKDAVAPPGLLPCVEESKAGGASWCCFAGHSCVNQACWDKETAVTYQYGCNDPTYEHENCPPKGGLDMGESNLRSPFHPEVACGNHLANPIFILQASHPGSASSSATTPTTRASRSSGPATIPTPAATTAPARRGTRKSPRPHGRGPSRACRPSATATTWARACSPCLPRRLSLRPGACQWLPPAQKTSRPRRECPSRAPQSRRPCP